MEITTSTLVLHRKIHQKIIISNCIEVEIVDINFGQVKLAIRAPKHIIVDREEISRKRLQNPNYKKEVIK
jgi:carbon storage regulator CsrA